MRSRLGEAVGDHLVRFTVWALIARSRRGTRLTTVKVAGARRSGHHALLEWMANGLEVQPVHWRDLYPYIRLSQSGRTLHINDANHHSTANIARVLWRRRRHLDQVENLIVSYEDCDLSSTEVDLIVPGPATHNVYVRRSTLNLVASRLRYGSADRGGSEWTPVDEELLLQLRANTATPHGWTAVNFDAWTTPEHRTQLATIINLRADIAPGMSSFGGGSSYTKMTEIPTSDSLRQRYRLIEWPRPIIDLLMQDDHRSLLTDDEVAYLRQVGV